MRVGCITRVTTTPRQSSCSCWCSAFPWYSRGLSGTHQIHVNNSSADVAARCMNLLPWGNRTIVAVNAPLQPVLRCLLWLLPAPTLLCPPAQPLQSCAGRRVGENSPDSQISQSLPGTELCANHCLVAKSKAEWERTAFRRKKGVQKCPEPGAGCVLLKGETVPAPKRGCCVPDVCLLEAEA